ncbi:MAG: DnaB-like helicase C-terminal domain-containing protein, partial [Flavobacteriaceae bacterium]|nr:DnaB-like helicase C-terminal domain-containing protein [Flavobacteriaceae bacterium]
DADIVSFIYRPEYYNIDEWDDDERTPSEGQAEFIVAKHRNGGLDNIRLKFIGHLGKFEDLDTFDSPFEFQSKMNPNNSDIPSTSLPNPDDVFGDSEDEDDTPF